MAVRGDGTVVVATPGNTSGLPSLMLVTGATGFTQPIATPTSA
jgi:hypothetical protein